ncbi:MAG: 2',5' RNA ligase family [Syntrophorhabdaceae bacterium PtaU1.Bin034]|nr:MAG: 2',5' RNA ligase family [Syntrophorhabdaceae bacterium PtaU1.Bin034]
MRAFLALEIPEDIIGYLKKVTERLAKRTGGVRWVRNEGIHITVKFLGETEDALAESMKDILAPMGELFGPIAARLGGLDAFPSRRSARVIVVKLKEGAEPIQAVFSEIEERLAGIDIEKEKRGLVPHITLGRRRVPKPFPNGDPMPIDEKDFVIQNLVLYKSTLTPGGAIYAPIWKIKLGGENG